MWVFGLVDTSVSPALGYVQVDEKRDAATLLPIINNVVKPGIVIHSDEWAAYRKIQSSLGFEHRTVNHSKQFVAPDGTHTQASESYWNKAKRPMKEMLGCTRDDLESYFTEFMWRERFADCPFKGALEIAKLYDAK